MHALFIPIQYTVNISWHTVRAAILFCAIFLYALWGSPTPDSFGVIEVFIALGLLIAVGPAGVAHAFGRGVKGVRRGGESARQEECAWGLSWVRPARVLFIYGIGVPLIVAVCAGSTLPSIIRDMIAFLFLLMPLFLMPLWQARSKTDSVLADFSRHKAQDGRTEGDRNQGLGRGLGLGRDRGLSIGLDRDLSRDKTQDVVSSQGYVHSREAELCDEAGLHSLTWRGIWRDIRRFQWTLLCVGVLFSMRSVLELLRIPFVGLGRGDAMFYLSNSPLVLMSLIFFSLSAMNIFMQNLTIMRVAQVVILVSLAVLPFLAIAMTLQRASVGAWVVGCVLMALYILVKRPHKGSVLLIAVAALGMCVWPYFSGLFDLLMHKTMAVGGNNRLEEFYAVWMEISGNPVSLLLGHGWGAHFQSPAVNYMHVNFTHSLLSAMILKTGLVGAGLVALYMMEMGRVLLGMLYRKNGMEFKLWADALLLPFAIAAVLYANYKSLDFGLILTLISAMSVYETNVRKHAPLRASE